MRLEQLVNKHNGEDIYIVGTGPSLRVFPLDFLRGRIIIGLNQAYRQITPTYSVTVHPELVLEYEQRPQANPTQWIIKKKPPMERLTFDDPKYYVFQTSIELQAIRSPQPDTLFLGHGIQGTAMHLAQLMGAKNVFLIGVDMTNLDGEHHGHDQHVRFLGVDPAQVYAEYRRTTAKVRSELRGKGVRVFSLSPLLGECDGTEDYVRLVREYNLPRLAPPVDTSTYVRKDAKR